MVNAMTLARHGRCLASAALARSSSTNPYLAPGYHAGGGLSR
jgi:hypothetical protein